ncbi:MAG TPA: AraC family transcriptional regulator [Caproiciproducens sp.]|nr:AraC family transcriptional regulator [Caproiciproducens sp.]
MTETELDRFLNSRTDAEKALDLIQAGKEYQADPKSPIAQFILNYKKYWQYPGLVHTLNEKAFMNEQEKVSFFIHPRLMQFRNANGDYTIGEHKHSFLEMLYVYSGECIHTIGGQKIAMKQGDISILDTNVKHSVTIRSNNDIIINCLMRKNYFDTAFFSRLANNDLFSNFFIHAVYQSKTMNDYILFHSAGNEAVRQTMVSLLCEYFDKKMCSNEIIDSYLVILFAQLLRVYQKDVNSENYAVLKENKISNIILYLQEHYQDATLLSTAQYFNFHPNYLSFVFKQLTGMRFIDFLHEYRLKNACLMLDSTNIPVEKIANAVGYANLHYFYQLFKKHYGTTPSEYRKKSKNTVAVFK